ncbi:transposase [Halopseudomonas nanhaiensis]|uniref:REP-associated tyrosine transposase n=1 Tax=Halopseudomonas nanhaiensis TaxID=2830842 RepID=UPI001CBACD3F|nr:transposase [Halopseudomonas nanhaiensis]UAW99406.1 transposase [Halopseudomonas nanhaiensis]
MHTPSRPASHRLRRGRVSEPGRIYLITTVTRSRKPVFNDLHAARRVIRTLANQRKVSTLAFVLMPDHLHWLFALGHESLDVTVGRFKSMSARALGRSTWQPGYHDRAVRDEEDCQKLARYVVANPLRAGLADSVGNYAHWDAVWL